MLIFVSSCALSLNPLTPIHMLTISRSLVHYYFYVRLSVFTKDEAKGAIKRLKWRIKVCMPTLVTIIHRYNIPILLLQSVVRERHANGWLHAEPWYQICHLFCLFSLENAIVAGVQLVGKFRKMSPTRPRATLFVADSLARRCSANLISRMLFISARSFSFQLIESMPKHQLVVIDRNDGGMSEGCWWHHPSIRVVVELPIWMISIFPSSGNESWREDDE